VYKIGETVLSLALIVLSRDFGNVITLFEGKGIIFGGVKV